MLHNSLPHSFPWKWEWNFLSHTEASANFPTETLFYHHGTYNVFFVLFMSSVIKLELERIHIINHSEKTTKNREKVITRPLWSVQGECLTRSSHYLNIKWHKALMYTRIWHGFSALLRISQPKVLCGENLHCREFKLINMKLFKCFNFP